MKISEIRKSIDAIEAAHGDIECRVLSKGFFEGFFNRYFGNKSDINFAITSFPDIEKIQEMEETEKAKLDIFNHQDNKITYTANHVDIVGERFDPSLFILQHETDKTKPVFRVIAYSHREANRLFRKYYLENKDSLVGTVLEFDPSSVNECSPALAQILKLQWNISGYDGLCGYIIKEINFGEVISENI